MQTYNAVLNLKDQALPTGHLSRDLSWSLLHQSFTWSFFVFSKWSHKFQVWNLSLLNKNPRKKPMVRSTPPIPCGGYLWLHHPINLRREEAPIFCWQQPPGVTPGIKLVGSNGENKDMSVSRLHRTKSKVISIEVWCSVVFVFVCVRALHTQKKGDHDFQELLSNLNFLFYGYLRVEQKVLNRGLHCEGPGVCSY